MKDIVKLGLRLCIITFATALMLAALNAVTAPIIAARVAQETQDSIMNIFPEASDVQAQDAATITALNQPVVMEAYLVEGASGPMGAAVKVGPNGFSGPIEMMVGVNLDGSVVSVQILSMSETPGLGTKTDTPEFLGQYESKMAPFASKGEGTAIAAISGATISSNAVTNGVNIAVEAAAALMQ